MRKDRIKWCLKKKQGIELVNPNPILSKSYMKEADETLENAIITKGKWKVIISYYACYNALYANLMKAGIKSEIHDCTIEIMELLGYKKEEYEFMKDLKEDRTKAQYYLKEIEAESEEKIKKFITRSKVILNSLNSKTIEEIRKQMKI